MKHIDIHSHLAWDLDDGIPSLESCQKLLLQASKDHITKIVATPHFVCGKHSHADIHSFTRRIYELKEVAKEYGIEIYVGSELFINDMLFQQIRNKELLPIENTNYILCEFDVRKQYDDSYDMIYDFIYELVVAGYTPILAHVERYFDKKIDLEAIRELVDLGCLIQVNTSSILNPNDQIMKKNIFSLIENNLVHVVATDSHNYKGRRSPNMSEAFSYLSDHFDSSNLERLFYENPYAIISNEQVLATNFKPHKRGLRRLFR